MSGTANQGHVAILDAQSGKLLHVWNSLCSNRTGLILNPLPDGYSIRDLGTRGWMPRLVTSSSLPAMVPMTARPVGAIR